MSKKGSASKIPDDCMPMCRTCAFFKPDKEANLGECHRLPPTVLTVVHASCQTYPERNLIT